ncbi:PRA1 family protein-domain-containing protein [Annulohypoxylon moriforme]|nr:PRA1 family protein-domain-containing protein [Annulohypoxylon moriforme]
MARIQIPLDVLTSRLNIQDRFAGFRNTSLSSRFANMRPVSEFLDFKRLSKPANFGEVQSRVNYNLGTFSSNYALVFVLLSVYALITNPLLLFDIILLVGGMWLLGRLNGQDLTIGTFQATSSQLYTGLLVTCGLLFLIASPFSTVLWLIGASGLGGRPRAPKFAPQWGRPSRRPRRGYEEEEDDIWGTGRRVVEELLDGEGTDTQGAENGGGRFASDPLRFTGVDLGGSGQARNGYAYQNSDEEDEDDDGNSTEEGTQATSEEEEDTDDENQAARRELEEALVQSALSRIRKAQSKGRQDVKLNKQELAALDRRRKRLQAEAEAAKRGGSRKQRKEKEQRYAVPLSSFDAPSRGPSGSNESLARKALPSTEQGPPMGRFHPPNASRSRPRSGTSSTSSTQRPQSRIRDSPPFDYQYVNAPPNQRHASDPSGRPQSSASTQNPFQYQTAGPRAAYGEGSAVVRSSPRRHRSRARREEELEDETTSDDAGNREIIVASPSPESERPKAKKSSPGQPIAKKKATSGTGKKRKGK